MLIVVSGREKEKESVKESSVEMFSRWFRVT